MQQRKHILFFLLFLVFFVPASAQSEAEPHVPRKTSNIPRSTTGYPDLDLYYSQLAKNTYKQTDSLKRVLQRTTPLDTLIAAYLDRGFAVLRDPVSLFDYYNWEITIYDWRQRTKLMHAVDSVARKIHSPRLSMLADFFRVHLINTNEYDRRTDELEQLARRYRKAGDEYMVAHILGNMWIESYYNQRFARGFGYGKRLADALDAIDDNYPFKGGEYFMLGAGYYQFKDYDRAVELLRKGLAYRGTHFGEKPRGFLRAWNHLASWHSMQGNLDSAAYYHRLILSSPESTADSPVHSAIALGNLGKIEMLQGDYDAAIALLDGALENLDGGDLDWDFSLGLHISLAECYLAKGDIRAGEAQLAIAHKGIVHFPEGYRLARQKDWYAMKSKYASRLGKVDEANAYLDSALIATRKHEQFMGQYIILLGEQELQEAQIQLQTQQIKRQDTVLVSVISALALISVALVFIITLYRRRNAAYKVLAQKAQEWAQDDRTRDVPALVVSGNSTGRNNGVKDPATKEDSRIMSLVEQEMTLNHAYREPGFTAEMLAERLGVHRNSLSRAINKVTGGNFSQYINGLRIKEAVRLISGSSHDDLRMEEFYEQVGFVNYTTFYRTFKQFTGLSPAEFQKQGARSVWNR